jgi:hypothetical protein
MIAHPNAWPLVLLDRLAGYQARYHPARGRMTHPGGFGALRSGSTVRKTDATICATDSHDVRTGNKLVTHVDYSGYRARTTRVRVAPRSRA